MASGLIGGLVSIFFRPAPIKVLEEAELGDTVLLRGRIVPRDLIESPLSAERCVYYSYSVDEWKPAVPGIGADGYWRNIERDEAITEFYLQIGSTRLIVSPSNAKVSRASGRELRERSYAVQGHRALEMLLSGGDEVEIAGVLASADDLFDDGRGYRASPFRYMLRAPESKRLQIRLLSTQRKREKQQEKQKDESA